MEEINKERKITKKKIKTETFKQIVGRNQYNKNIKPTDKSKPERIN